MQLSVVIPFYQVEKYIGACLDALAALRRRKAKLLVDDWGGTAARRFLRRHTARRIRNARVIRRAQNGSLSRRATRGWTRRGANMSIFWIATMCRARRRSGG